MRRAFRWSLFLVLGCAAFGADNKLTRRERHDGWVLLFDGKTLDGWMNSRGKPSGRPVDQGCINPHECGAYMLVHKQLWENFILSLDFKVSPQCNSGIFFRTSSLIAPPGHDVGWNGLEMQVLDSPDVTYTSAGAIYGLVKPKRNAMKPAGEWNHAVITCDRNIITVNLNREEVTRMDLDQFTQPHLRPDGTPHMYEFAFKDRPRKGYIGLQDHGSDCWYKNIKLKPLP